MVDSGFRCTDNRIGMIINCCTAVCIVTGLGVGITRLGCRCSLYTGSVSSNVYYLNPVTAYILIEAQVDLSTQMLEVQFDILEISIDSLLSGIYELKLLSVIITGCLCSMSYLYLL